MRKIKTAAVAVGSITALSVIGLQYLLSLRLTVKPSEAIEEGQQILNNYKRILAITAHPDDLEFFLGGTLTLLTESGKDVGVIDVTNGERGTNVKNLAQIREEEQKRASEVMNLRRLEFLHLPDLQLKDEPVLEPTLRKAIENIDPDVILAFDPKTPLRAIIHPDHIAVGKAVTRIVEHQLKKSADLFYYATRQPDTVVDIASSIQTKITALQCHESQLRFGKHLYGYPIRLFGRYCARETRLTYGEVLRKHNNRASTKNWS